MTWSSQGAVRSWPRADAGDGARRRLGAEYREIATLADGTPVVLRPIRPDDAPLLQSGLRELSEQSRYLRFHSPRTSFTPDELRSLTEIDGEAHFALAALTRRSRLVGVGRFIRTGASAEAELALVVADELQGKGLGTLLLSRLREAALERTVTRFTGLMLAENRRMGRLLRKLGGRIGIASRGVCDIDLALT